MISIRALVGLSVLLITGILTGCEDPIALSDDLDVVAVEVTSMTGVEMARYSAGSWTFATGDALHLDVGEDVAVRIVFVGPHGEREELPESGAEHTLRVEVADPTIAAYAHHGDHGDFEGIGVGVTHAKIFADHGGHSDFETTPGLPIEVSEDH